MKYLFIVFVCFFTSCVTTKVKVVDGDVVESKKVLSLSSKIDTVYYKTLWNDEVITYEEYNRRWDQALKNARKEIERELKQ